ncbi:hypothetical protein ACLSYT_11370, partial [Avibacterium avium]
FSASASYNQSKMNADYASVQEQSGLFAGDEGYQIDVRKHTDLKGGLITSTAQAETEGKNRFETGTLSYSDIENHANYSGSAFGAGVQADINGGWDGRQVRDENDNIILNEDGSRASRVNQGIGFGYDKDSQSSLTKSGINTTNLHIRDEKAQQSLTGKSVDETLKDIKTEITTESAQANAGTLTNNFDKDKLQKELAIQQDVTKNFAPVAAQGVAWASEQLGAVQNYEVLSARKSQVEAALSNTTNPEERSQLQSELTTLTDYLNDNQTRYDLWKEGGVGRALLHAAAGGVLTGNVSGAAAAGTTSLSAPLIEKLGEKAEEKFGKAGKMAVNATAGLAIGAAVGNGNVGAISAAANTDWNNRQLHPDEMKRIKELSQGDKEKEQRLTIAACALVHCSAQLSEENPIYEQTKNLEKLGSSEAYAEERALLKQQKVLKEMVVGLPPSDETMSVPHSLFTYGMNDKLLDKTSKANETYGVSTRIGGALQATGGALISASSTASAITACAGSSGLACGGAAALGAIGTSYGVDQANAGVNSLLTGRNYSTYGSQLLSQMTGISPETAEAVYGLPLMWNGGNALRTGSNAISHSVASLKNSEILTKGIDGTRSTLNSVSKWAAAHPNATEAIVGGTVSTGFDIYNGNATPEGTAMNYVYSRALAGKSLSTQLSLGTIYQGVISTNNASKTDQEIVSDILKKDAGTIVAYKAVSIGNAGGKAKLPILLGSSLLGGAIENTDLYKENKDKK